MNLQWMGSILIILGCGSVGFLMALQEKREIHSMRQLMKALVFMDSELQYHLTPLPELFQRSAGQVSGPVRTLLLTMARELAEQVLPNAAYCMEASLGKVPELPKQTAAAARELGNALGCFDLDGQRKGIDGVLARRCKPLPASLQSSAGR